MTCPNRDGKVGFGGCIFCGGNGSGSFCPSVDLSITDQIEEGKKLLKNKIKEGGYIAYFQSHTNTYAAVPYLRKIFYEAVNHPDIVGISIGTRPDCLEDEVLKLLEELAKIKPLWVELGLQTIHENTANLINRCYPLKVYDEVVKNLKSIGAEVVTHVILGLPGESSLPAHRPHGYPGHSHSPASAAFLLPHKWEYPDAPYALKFFLCWKSPYLPGCSHIRW